MESVHLVLYFNRAFDLYEQIIAEYLAFHTESHKRGMLQFEVARHKFCCFFPIIRSVPS